MIVPGGERRKREITHASRGGAARKGGLSLRILPYQTWPTHEMSSETADGRKKNYSGVALLEIYQVLEGGGGKRARSAFWGQRENASSKKSQGGAELSNDRKNRENSDGVKIIRRGSGLEAFGSRIRKGLLVASVEGGEPRNYPDYLNIRDESLRRKERFSRPSGTGGGISACNSQS